MAKAFNSSDTLSSSLLTSVSCGFTFVPHTVAFVLHVYEQLRHPLFVSSARLSLSLSL
jgi:hypothetical protein